MIEEAQKAMEEVEALKKLSARQEPLVESSKNTTADVRIEYLSNPVQVKVGKVSSPTANVSQVLVKVTNSELMRVILSLLKRLTLEKDVRPVLHDKFHMLEWFEKHSIPSV